MARKNYRAFFHRADAAFFAISDRLALLSFAARALPPFKPPKSHGCGVLAVVCCLRLRSRLRRCQIDHGLRPLIHVAGSFRLDRRSGILSLENSLQHEIYASLGERQLKEIA
jgi:hypothetical protein